MDGRESAARALSRALGKAAPHEREALLIEALALTADCLAIIKGNQGAAEYCYMLADRLATK